MRRHPRDRWRPLPTIRRVNSGRPASVASASPQAGALAGLIADEIQGQGGWLGFERFMELALYAPGLGYYARTDRQFGHAATSGSDFVTAPELSPLFGAALARQVAQALQATGTAELWEFGAGSGVLAAGLLAALGAQVQRYHIVDLSTPLRERQRTLLAAQVPAHAAKVRWLDRLPPRIEGVVLGNEVLDAMPVLLLHHDGRRWLERGVGLAHPPAEPPHTGRGQPFQGRFDWRDRPTTLQPPVPGPFAAGTVTELGRQAAGFVRTLAQHLHRGAAFFIDYGFPEAEYYHPQRHGGTLMCHRGHRADTDPLTDVGDKDITAHVDFSAIALAGQAAGFTVLGYTSQGRFLMNCGLLDLLPAADLRAANAAHRLLAEHEMGELFKVIGFAPQDTAFDALGFAAGDRSHTL
jgi:SAM-dependent MidA family methyltransferase